MQEADFKAAPKNCRIRNWIGERHHDRVPIGSLLMALECVTLAEESRVFLAKASRLARDWQVAADDLREWRRMWLNPGAAVLNMADSLLGNECGEIEFERPFRSLRIRLRELERWSSAEWANLRRQCGSVEFQREVGEAKRELTNDLEQSVSSAYWGSEEVQECEWRDEEILKVAFHFRVHLASILEFGLRCDVVYKLAAEGDLQSLERVLLIDPAVSQLPEIAKQLRDCIRRGDLHRLEVLREARSSEMSLTWKQKRTKCLLMAQVIEFSELWHSALKGRVGKLTPHSMQGLFDAVACDRSRGGTLRDQELGEPDSVRKMINGIRRKSPLKCWDLFL